MNPGLIIHTPTFFASQRDGDSTCSIKQEDGSQNVMLRIESCAQKMSNNSCEITTTTKKLTAAEQTFDFRFNIEESEATLYYMCVCVKEQSTTSTAYNNNNTVYGLWLLIY